MFQKLNASLKSGEVRAVDAVRAYQWAALKRFGRADNVCQVIAMMGLDLQNNSTRIQWYVPLRHSPFVIHIVA